MKLEQQAAEEQVEDDEGTADYQPLAPDDGEEVDRHVCRVVPMLILLGVVGQFHHSAFLYHHSIQTCHH